jgi:hypothetical protein
MDNKQSIFSLAARLVAYAVMGSACGSYIGGLFSVVVGTVIEAVDPSMAGLGSLFVFLASAVVAALGGALAGAVVARSRRPLIRMIGTICAGFVVALYPSMKLWIYDDTSWPYGFLMLGGGTLVGTVAAGILVARVASSFGATTGQDV